MSTENPIKYPWTAETMRIINELTPTVEGKAFDPDWFLLRQRFEQFEASMAPQLPAQGIADSGSTLIADAELDEMKRRADAATPGPMFVIEGDREFWFSVSTRGPRSLDSVPYWDSTGMERREDAEFYAHARTDLPRLIDAYRLQSQRLAVTRAPITDAAIESKVSQVIADSDLDAEVARIIDRAQRERPYRARFEDVLKRELKAMLTRLAAVMGERDEMAVEISHREKERASIKRYLSIPDSLDALCCIESCVYNGNTEAEQLLDGPPSSLRLDLEKMQKEIDAHRKALSDIATAVDPVGGHTPQEIIDAITADRGVREERDALASERDAERKRADWNDEMFRELRTKLTEACGGKYAMSGDALKSIVSERDSLRAVVTLAVEYYEVMDGIDPDVSKFVSTHPQINADEFVEDAIVRIGRVALSPSASEAAGEGRVTP